MDGNDDGDLTPQEYTIELEIEDLIAELCLNISSDPVKFCLRKYKYGKSVQDIENNIFKERHDTLKAAANFLRVSNFNNDKNKRTLSHLIVCKIQNLLPDNCSKPCIICKSRTYNTRKSQSERPNLSKQCCSTSTKRTGR